MVVRKNFRWLLLSSFLLISHAFWVNDCVAWPAKEIPVQTLTTAGGMKVLFSENHTIPAVTLYIGIKNRPTYPAFQEKHLIHALMYISETKSLRKIEPEHLLAKESTSIYHRVDAQAVTDLTFQVTNSPDQLEATLAHVMESLSLQDISTGDLEKAQTSLMLDHYNNPRFSEENITSLMIAFAAKNNKLGSSRVNYFNTICSSSLEDLKSYITHHLTQDNLVVSAAGDIKPAQLLKVIEATLGKLPTKAPKQPITKHKNLIELPKTSKKIYIFKNTPHSIIHFAHPWFFPTDSNYRFGQLFAELFFVIIKNYLRENHQDINSINEATIWPSPPLVVTMIGGQIILNNSDVPRILTGLKQFFQALKKEGLNNKQLYQLKQSIQEAEKKPIFLQDDLPFLAFMTSEEIQSNPVAAAYYLFRQETNRLEKEEQPRPRLLGRGRLFYTDHVPEPFYSTVLSELEKNLEKVNRVIKKHVDPNKLSFVEVGLVNHL